MVGANKDARRSAMDAIRKYFDENGSESIVERERLMEYIHLNSKDMTLGMAGQYVKYFSETKNMLEKVDGGFRLSVYFKVKMKSKKNFTLKDV